MSTGTRRSLTLAWAVLFILSLAMQAGVLANPPSALAVHDDGDFELDGNALAEGGAGHEGDDWSLIDDGSGDPSNDDAADASLFIPGSVEAEGPDTTYFAQGGSKDHHDISEWHHSDTDVAPDKDELIDVFAAAYDTADGTVVYFGADKFDDSGDAQIGFWFFQNAVSLGANGLFNGVHEVGDVLVLSDFTNGGSVDLICVYEWNPPGDNIAAGVPTDTGCDMGDNLTLAAAGAECDVSGPDGDFEVCAIVNAGVETSPWPFANKDAPPANVFGAGQFFEGGINLDDLFGGDAPCFSGFLAETRSSQEVEAQLKDFALGNLDTCEPPTIATQASPSSLVIGGGTVTDLATFTGNSGPVTGSAAFFVCGPATPACATGGTPLGSVTIVSGSATSAAFTPPSPGTYCFRVEYTPDAAGALNYSAGSHTNLTTECFTVTKASPAIVTFATQSVSAGNPISDSATLSGGFNPTGSITFRAYGPDDGTCAGAAIFTSAAFPVSGNGTYGPASFTPAAAGVYRWIASYGGDANNNAVAGVCNDAGENDTVTKLNPTIVTSAAESVTIGAAIHDSATLAGGVNPTGTITFNLYGPNDATCAGAAVFTTSLPVSGNATYGPVSFTPTAVGFYRWIASYGGDANNNAASGACNDAGETDQVNKTNPTIATVLHGGGQNGTSITVPLGTAVHDSSSLSGATADAGGTVHYQVFSDSDCETLVFDAGTKAVTNGVPADSNSFTINLAGTYYWQADYSGDAKNNSASSACNLEIVTVAANIPTITTSANETVTIGAAIHDSATLAGGFNPTGSITFRAWGNETCAGTAVFTSAPVTVSGNGTYGPVEFTPSAPGVYHWIASYSGDANNAAVSGGCGDAGENDTVQKATPAISTNASPTVNVGGQIWDVANVTGGFSPTGTVTFRLYGPNDATCAGAVTFTSTNVLVAGTATSGQFTPSQPGTYRWVATYNGDANNNSVAGACNDANENVLVTQPVIHAVKLVATGDTAFAPTSAAEPGDLVNFQITVSNTGNGPATNVLVTDDINDVLAHSSFVSCSDSCSNVAGVLSWTIPTLVAGGSKVLTFTVELDDDFPVGVTHLPNVVVVVGPGSNCLEGSEDPDCDTDTVVNQPQLTILKGVSGNTGGTAVNGLPIAKIGDILTYTLNYDITSPPANNGVITDPIPAGLEYVAGSATTDAQFDVVNYNAGTRTLTWNADVVSVDGTLSFRVTVLATAPALAQPIVNVATIDSDDTEPDDDDASVLVQVVLAITNPPTSTIDNSEQAPSNPGFSLMLILLALAAFALSLGFVTPVPARARRRTEGRR